MKSTWHRVNEFLTFAVLPMAVVTCMAFIGQVRREQIRIKDHINLDGPPPPTVYAVPAEDMVIPEPPPNLEPVGVLDLKTGEYTPEK